MSIESRRANFATVALALSRATGLYGYVAPLELARVSALQQLGWQRSHVGKESVDGDGNPIPWFSYAMIHFLSAASLEGLTVFEYGMGNSTRWWLDRGARIRAVDHHLGWFERIEQAIGTRAELLHRALGPEYIGAVAEAATRYDVVVVDGRERAACAVEAAKHVNDGGVIIWDDSDRERYQEGAATLRAQGFRKLPFRSFGPIGGRLKETSLFYRPNNCLGV